MVHVSHKRNSNTLLVTKYKNFINWKNHKSTHTHNSFKNFNHLPVILCSKTKKISSWLDCLVYEFNIISSSSNNSIQYSPNDRTFCHQHFVCVCVYAKQKTKNHDSAVFWLCCATQHTSTHNTTLNRKKLLSVQHNRCTVVQTVQFTIPFLARLSFVLLFSTNFPNLSLIFFSPSLSHSLFFLPLQKLATSTWWRR